MGRRMDVCMLEGCLPALLVQGRTKAHMLRPVEIANHRAIHLLGGSWVVLSRVISPLIWLITIVTPLIP